MKTSSFKTGPPRTPVVINNRMSLGLVVGASASSPATTFVARS